MDYLRQRDIFDPGLFSWPVTIIGTGGIGSAAALSIAKLGIPAVRLWDPDVVEPHNGPNQLLFGNGDVGKHKASVIADRLSLLAGDTHVTATAQKFAPPENTLDGIVIGGVDSMAERMAIWQAVEWNENVPLYLDGRLGGEVLELFTILPTDLDDVEWYREYLFPDSEAAVLPCSAQSIIYPACILAGMMASHIVRWVRKERYARRIQYDCVTGMLVRA